MATAARFRESSIAGIVAIALIVDAGCRNSDVSPPAPPAKPIAAPVARPPVDAPPPSPPSPPSPSPDAPPIRSAVARRCALAGDPLTGPCLGGGSGLAFDAAGLLYIVDGARVRRYRPAANTDATECRFDADPGYAVELPAERTRGQKLDGPVYMRSGGPDWRVTFAAGAVYAHDLLGGLHRIDRGKAEPTCPDLLGISSLAARGKTLVAGRASIDQLQLPGCKATPIGDLRGNVWSIGDALYTVKIASRSIARITVRTATPLGGDAEPCSIVALTACGDGMCVADGNCMKVMQLAGDGSMIRSFDTRELFRDRPWTMVDADTAPDGTVHLLVRHREAAQDRICEQAVYAIPAATFAP